MNLKARFSSFYWSSEEGFKAGREETKIKQQKFVAALAASALSVYLFSVGCFAYTGSATVNVHTKLNMRKSASTSSKVLKKLKNKTTIKIIGQSGKWYKISYSGKKGWVAKSYVKIPSTKKAPATKLVTSCGGDIQSIVDTAYDMLGVRYVYGACSPSKGFDCSGLTKYAYSKVGITLPHKASGQASYGEKVSRSDLQAGDLVFFDTNGGHNDISHVGIYVGGGCVIQAETGHVMKVAKISLSTKYWSNAYMTARRLIY